MTNKSELQNRVAVTNAFGTKARFVDGETYIKTAELAEFLRDDGIGKPTYYTDGEMSREIEEHPHDDNALTALENLCDVCQNLPNALKNCETIRTALTAPRYEGVDVEWKTLTPDRVKEIMRDWVGMPHSMSLHSAIMQVQNELYHLNGKGLKIMREVK